jgi:glycosyltransferase involved in cell wall biosynthesis
MEILHIGPPHSAATLSCQNSGGLDRFLAELIKVQSHDHHVRLLTPELKHYQKAEEAIDKNDPQLLIGVGEGVLQDITADIYHLHDWYGAIVLDYLYYRGIRNVAMSSHLPLRRGFTYKDTTLSWRNKVLLEDRALHASQKVSVPSAYTKSFLVSEYGLPEDSIDIIPHGVDTAFFKGDISNADTFPTLLFVGRLTEQKSPDLLLRAFKYVVQKYATAQLYFIGKGPRKDRLIQLADHLSLGNKVVFDFAESKEQLSYYYRKASLLVFPSQFEPFGLIGLEAMASGCPVLATSPSGAEEYLNHDETVNSYSPKRLGMAILEKLDTLGPHHGEGHHFRQRAKAWKWESSKILYDNIYMEILG